MSLQPRIPYSSQQCKLTFSFHGPTKRWREVHAFAGVLTGGVIPSAALTAAVLMANKRWNILASDCFLDQAEITIFGGGRQSLLYSWPTGGAPGSSNNGKENNSNDSVRAFMHSSQGPTKSIYLGGIPDEIIVSDAFAGQADANATWWGYFQTYINVLCNGSWGFMGNRNQFTEGPRRKILTIASTALAPNVIVVTTVGVLRAAVGDLIRIGRVPGASPATPINQIVKVTASAAPGIYTVALPVSQTAAVNLAGGYAQIMQKVFYPYGFLQGISVGTRRRGNSGGPKGRNKFKRTIGY
jgi:hypothetical protein